MRTHGSEETADIGDRDGAYVPRRVSGSAARPAEARLLALQQTAGNQAVAGFVQRFAGQGPVSAEHGGGSVDPGQGSAEMIPGETAGVEGVLIPPEEIAAAPSLANDEGSASLATAPAGSGLRGPRPAPWAAVSSAGEDGLQAIPGPSVASLPTLQAPGGGNPWRTGWTSFPVNRKAPQFEFNTTEYAPPVGPPSYASAPTLKQSAYEGDSVCWYLGPGLHKSSLVDGGKPVYFEVSAAISARDGAAEGEHSNDFKQARDISIKEAETVLSTHVVGKTFPSAGSKESAEKHVLDTITAKLTHPDLGNDQTQWDAKYEALYRKSGARDTKGWHSFGVDSRSTNAAGDVILKIGNGTTSIGTTTSASLIIY